jgi:hypothetical protein
MKPIQNLFKLSLVPLLLTFVITSIMPGLPTAAQAGEGAAFIEGMVAGHVVSGAVRRSRIRTAATVQAANQPKTQTIYVQQQPATTTSAQPAAASKPSAEDRIKELDKLAAGGYITPEEYKAKKKAILDSI